MKSHSCCTLLDRQFELAWRASLPALSRQARRLTRGHPDQADDLLAITALKALLYMRRVPRVMDHPKSFLFVVLRHAHLDIVRSRRREEAVLDDSMDLQCAESLLLDEHVPSALEHAEQVERLAHVDLAVRAMPSTQQRLFAMRFMDELPYPVIADRLGIGQCLVRKRVQLIRQRLRLALSGAASSITTPNMFTAARGRRYGKSNAAGDATQSTPHKGHAHV